MKLAVVTICEGELYRRIAELTHPTLKAYAHKIGAEFIIMRGQRDHIGAGWRKLDMPELLETFDRILYVDSDILIRSDAPNIFDLVPADKVGLFDEGEYVDRRQPKHMYAAAPTAWWASDTYYNTGVLVVSRGQEMLFLKPHTEVDNFYEQTHLNHNIFRFKIPVFKLPYRFNRMLFISKLTGESRLDSYFLHYAGQFSSSNKAITEMSLGVMKDDVAAWKRGGWDPKEDLSCYD